MNQRPCIILRATLIFLKMAKRTTSQDEIDRMAERIFTSQRTNIFDRVSFDVAFSLEFSVSDRGMTEKQKTFRDKVFRNFKNSHPSLIPKQSELKEFKKAGGGDFIKDRQKTAKRIARTKKEYEKLGAKKSDFKGIDTRPKDFSVPSRVRGRIVYSERVIIARNRKRVVVYRDSKGRFASVSKKIR